MSGTLSGGTAASAKATFDAVAKDLSLVAMLKDPFALTPGSRARNSRRATSRLRRRPAVLDGAVRDGDHQHPQRASLQHADGFSVRQGFRLRRDGADRSRREGRSQRQAGDGRQRRKDRRPARRSRARGRRRKSARTASTICSSSRSRPTAARSAQSVKGDRDPGYGSTSKMISECAICLLRDTPGRSSRHLDAGRGDEHRLIKRLVDHAGLTFDGREVSRALWRADIAGRASAPASAVAAL